MAVNTGADLILLHVIQAPNTFDVPVTQYEYDSMLENAEEELMLLKAQLSIRVEDEINITTKAVFSTMAFELHKMEVESNPFLIVIGPERQTAAERFFFGSGTFSIAKHLPCPVIIIPENTVYRHIKKIGLATDLEDIEEIPVETVRAMVELFDASLDIIHVCKSSDEKAACESGIAAITEKLKEFNPRFQFEINDDVANGINAYANRNREGFIIVLPKKHGFFSSLFRESQSKKIGLTPTVPIISIK